ncbi:MAG: InlB B-repeat-containing protein [Acholeplasmataceae bacterium]
MKKFSLIMLALMLTLLLIVKPTYAAYIENPSTTYKFDSFTGTVAGLTLTIDDDTQVFSVTGTMTATQASFTIDDLFTANTGGYLLSSVKDYLITYEYNAGTTFEGTRLELYTATTSNPYGPKTNVMIEPDDYQKLDGAILEQHAQWADNMLVRFYGAVGNSFEISFIVNIYEYTTTQTNDINLFTDETYTTTSGDVSFSIANYNTITLSGSATSSNVVILTDKLNTNLDPDGAYLVKYIYVSGSMNDTTGFKLSPFIINGDTWNVFDTKEDIKEYTTGQIFQGIESLSIDLFAQVSVTYTDFVFKLLVEEIDVDDETVVDDVDEITASDLGLEISVYGNQIAVDDYFKFIIVGDTYQLVAKDDDYNVEFEGNYYVYLFNVLNNGTYGINIGFGDDETNYSYQFQELNRSSGSTTWTLSSIGYTGTSTNPSVSISDLGDNTRQYNVYDGNVLKYSADSSYFYVAKWEGLFIDIPSSDIVEQSTVSYYIDDAVDSSLAVDLGSKLVKPEDPVESGYTFIGWFDVDNNLWDFSANAVTTSTLDLYANFVADTVTVFNVYFDSNEGSAIDTRIIVDGELLVEPSDPILYGHAFEGWYTDEELTVVYDFADAVTAEMTLYAKFIIGEFTITFVPNGGSDVDSITALYGAAIVNPNNPERTGYVFGGWYSDEDLETVYTFNTMPGEDTTLYAKWVPTTNTIPIISEPGEPLEFLGIAWYLWVIGAAAIYYFGFNKKGRKVLGLK